MQAYPRLPRLVLRPKNQNKQAMTAKQQSLVLRSIAAEHVQAKAPLLREKDYLRSMVDDWAGYYERHWLWGWAAFKEHEAGQWQRMDEKSRDATMKLCKQAAKALRGKEPADEV